jgi:tetratricopeptide (TPR) repeat protein
MLSPQLLSPPILSSQYLLTLEPLPAAGPDSAPAPIDVAEPPPLVSARPAKRAIRAKVIETVRGEPSLEVKARPEPELDPDAILEPIPAAQPDEAKPKAPQRLSRGRSVAAPGEKLYQQALTDKEAGNFVAAYTNVKLALVFDRQNTDYRILFEEMAHKVGRMTQGETPAARAAVLLERATREESLNNIDQAIALLEEALTLTKDPAYYNRLGVMLAMKKRDLERGREMLQKAVDLAPSNRTYMHNLEKVTLKSERDAGKASTAGGKNTKERGLFGLFGKRR